ncbi:hypothetical protein [Stenotrophomonas sp.]|uniref:hypothetical protein n=1 Tax=Stenotrophomonas sp. TaxID=69392 RepID=UPI0028AF1D2B|nr:hypothetical protein [Stenotrophomonas sp.]
MYLVTGDLETAQAWLPHATMAELQQASGEALATLLRVLSASALRVDLCLRAAAAAAAGAECPVA